MHILRLIGTAAAFLSVPTWARSSEVDERDIVVTASGIAQPREERGLAISVVSADELDQLQLPTVADALQTLPGVAVARRGPLGGQTSVFIRGANSSQTLVLIDGVRVNDPSSPNAAFDFGSLSAGNIGRVELLRGPNAVIWGSQAIGGVVSIETLAPTSQGSLRAVSEYGSHDTLRSAVNLSGSRGRIAASIGGAFTRSDGISSLVGGTERDGFRNWAGNGRAVVALTSHLDLDMRTYLSDSRIEYDSPFGAGANALPVTDNRQTVLYAGLNAQLADDRWHNRLAYTRTTVGRIGTDPVAFSFNNFIARAAVDRVEFRGNAGISRLLSLVYGAEYERTFASTSFEGAAPDVARNSVVSGYAQVTVRPFPGLALTAGARHDRFEEYGGQTSFGADIAYAPNDGHTLLRATYAQGFRAPSLSEGQPPFGNPDLRPETATNMDLGIEQRLNDGIDASVTLFRRRSDDLIAFSFATFRSENIERVHSDGVEIAFRLRPADGVDVQFAYTLTDAINRSTGAAFGNRLVLRPRHSAYLSGDWQTPWGPSVGASMQLIGDSFDDAANQVSLDGYALAAVRASLPLSRAVDLFGRVENLFDASYRNVAGYATYGRTLSVGLRARL